MSKHLSLLAGAGVLGRVKDGQRVFYGVKSPLVTELCGMVCAHLGM